MNYILHLLIYFNIYAMIAISLNMVVGYTNLLTLAHAGYYAIGCYTYALVTLKLNMGFLPALVLAFIIAAVMSLAISLPAWRFKGDFFVLVSLAVQVFLYSLFYNWVSSDAAIGTLKNLTNGPYGIPGIPKPSIFGIKFDSIGMIFILSSVLLGICLFISWNLLKSPWGRLLKGIRDDELLARNIGKNVRLAKIQVIAIACGMAAAAGTVYASYISYIDPTAASLDDSILFLCMVLVGGVGNFRGPIVGAAVLLAFPEILRFLSIPDSIAANVRLLLYGLLLVLVVRLRPQGIAGEYRIE
jgi:branched-chain amino acid transport system permease protein